MSGSAVRKQISPLICAIRTVPTLMTRPWCSAGWRCLHVPCSQPNPRDSLTGKFCSKDFHLVDLAALMTTSTSGAVVRGLNGLSGCWAERAPPHAHPCRRCHGFWSAVGFVCCAWAESRRRRSWARMLLWRSATEAVPPHLVRAAMGRAEPTFPGLPLWNEHQCSRAEPRGGRGSLSNPSSLSWALLGFKIHLLSMLRRGTRSISHHFCACLGLIFYIIFHSHHSEHQSEDTTYQSVGLATAQTNLNTSQCHPWSIADVKYSPFWLILWLRKPHFMHSNVGTWGLPCALNYFA